MRFPPSERVRFESNPLIEVICQIRFPRILRIDSEDPIDFQERIKGSWPVYESKVEFPLASVFAETPKTAVDPLPAGLERLRLHEFYDMGKKRKLVLSGSFISLSTLSYTSWEEFYGLLEYATESLATIYSPPFCTRVGLRYKDLIVRSDIGLDFTRWDELLQEPVLGPLAARDIPEEDILGSQVTFGCSLGFYDANINIMTSLAQRTEDQALGCLIDTDCFTDLNLEFSSIKGVLDEFNTESRNFFNWAIKPQLRAALKPISINA